MGTRMATSRPRLGHAHLPGRHGLRDLAAFTRHPCRGRVPDRGPVLLLLRAGHPRRDLHDLLGHSLTAIAVKADLASRIAAKEQSSAQQEITEVGKLSRQTLADVRAAVSGYREVTLANELARGKELLRASGVTPDL